MQRLGLRGGHVLQHEVHGHLVRPGPLAIEMRRRQIQQGVGDRCNPEYEAWLGCK